MKNTYIMDCIVYQCWGFLRNVACPDKINLIEAVNELFFLQLLSKLRYIDLNEHYYFYPAIFQFSISFETSFVPICHKNIVAVQFI